MRHGSRPFRALIALACAAPLLGATAAPAGVSVTANITAMRAVKGMVRACLTSAAKDFPDCKVAATSRKLDLAVTGTSMSMTFTDVPPGTYAISIIHDENGNGKMDRAMMMMPREGYAFSRDAKVVMGPPKFKAASFVVAGAAVSLPIKMRYMF